MSDPLEELEPVISFCRSNIHSEFHQQISDLPTPKNVQLVEACFYVFRKIGCWIFCCCGFDLVLGVFLLSHREQVCE